MRQFLRRARLTIGLGEKALAIESLRMRFEVVKNQFSNRIPNSATIDVVNLSRKTRERIEEFGETVRLDVGYGGVLRALFIGQLRHNVPTHEATEWITRLYCMDAFRPLIESRVNLTFGTGTSVESVIRSVVETFGPNTAGAVLQDMPTLPNLLSPLVATGSSREFLNSLGESYGFRWGFQDGRLEFVGPDPHFVDRAIRISKATGMKGSPVVTDLGVTVTTLLNPGLRVHRQIVIESVGAGVKVGQIETRKFIPTLATGTYTIGEIVFTGDTHGNTWDSRIQTYRPPTEGGA